jgi:hypothetical protein
MRESLKNLFSHQIILEDKSLFYYSINPYQLTNALGNDIAILSEYTFSKKGEENPVNIYKLYKTKEGNWYDVEEATAFSEKNIVRMLKSAIDLKENNIVTE